MKTDNQKTIMSPTWGKLRFVETKDGPTCPNCILFGNKYECFSAPCMPVSRKDGKNGYFVTAKKLAIKKDENGKVVINTEK